MKRYFLLFFAYMALFSATAHAEICPELSESSDWDLDGIPDSEDACCYVATGADFNPDEVCPDMSATPADEDLNGNGEFAGSEGKCCVTSQKQCVKLKPGQTCEAAGISVGDEVLCDRLLVYDNDGNENPYDYCSESPCVCFAIEDYDRDGVGSHEDNCPTVYNPMQLDSDEDGWGDGCDLCKNNTEIENPLGSCERGICRDEDCVLVYNPSPTDPTNAQDFLHERCGISPSHDGDGDGVGDECDNCAEPDLPAVEMFNPDQRDADGDGSGDVCDPCPRDSGITDFFNVKFVDLDSDGSDDNLCDNCLDAPNSDQANSDDDPWGDACDTCPNLATTEPEPDDDGDGAGNACDRCPHDGTKVTPGICGCGVEDQDKDEDGTPDCNDACPKVPFEDTTLDTDEDDVPDACDNCPNLYNPEQRNADSDLFGDACGSIEYTGAFNCNAATKHQGHNASLVTTLLSLF